jgi:anaerobic C4-dicarboxylate transporter
MTILTIWFKYMKASLIWTILLGTVSTSCSKKDSRPPAADKTTLQTTIASAQGYDVAIEGTKRGQYELGSKAAFKTAVDAAIAVLTVANPAQTAVNNATTQLQAAIDVFETKCVKEIAEAHLIVI